MCGIVAYVGHEQAAPILLEGLASLEYRGYDSAGIAVLDGEQSIVLEKRAGKLGVLRAAVDGRLPEGTTGIGHTRWATHGGATDANAHPHFDCSGDVVVIHNGIIENYTTLRDELQRTGHRFASDTDTEVVPHLVELYLSQGRPLLDAVRLCLARIEGTAALVVASRREPDQIIGARLSNAGAVVVGYGDGEMLLASDLQALLRRTRKVVHLAHGEIVVITSDGARYVDLTGAQLVKEPVSISFEYVAAERGQYRHFMQKEIYEQPTALLDTIRQHANLEARTIEIDGIEVSQTQIDRIQRVVLIGMGTSLHAAMLGRVYFERIAHLPAEVDNASEFRYRNALLGPDVLVVSISQSGETVDTLAAMDEVSRTRALQITVCNVPGAQSTRVAGATVLTRCGPEIGVASTKTFTAAAAALYMLAAWLGRRKGTLSGDAMHTLVDDLAHLPGLVSRACDMASSANVYAVLARKYGTMRNALFLGRGLQYPVALEGALKLKEITYIHAEGYAAGEMKHGPIALIDSEMPVVAVAPRDRLYEKIISNIQQVQAREGRVIAIGTEGDDELAELADDVLWTPAAPELLQPVVCSIPVQLMAYEIAVFRGNDVDQPRNLAKTVTVL